LARASAWRWSNFPIPEPLVIPLVAGILIHIIKPIRILPSSWLFAAVGCLLVMAAILLGGWSVRAAGDVDISNPDAILFSGPYAHTRKPMYVAWAVGYAEITLVVGSLWLLVPLPLGLLAFTL
jgi:protein-S-isoprenylcysteine O-methyltransferase Ste14